MALAWPVIARSALRAGGFAGPARPGAPGSRRGWPRWQAMTWTPCRRARSRSRGSASPGCDATAPATLASGSAARASRRAGEVASSRREHAYGRVGRCGERRDFGGRRGGDPGQRRGAGPSCRYQAGEHVERYARVPGERSPDVVAGVVGERSHHVVADRGVLGQLGADPGDGVAGQRLVHLRGQVAAGGERPSQQPRGVVGETGDGFGGGWRGCGVPPGSVRAPHRCGGGPRRARVRGRGPTTGALLRGPGSGGVRAARRRSAGRPVRTGVSHRWPPPRDAPRCAGAPRAGRPRARGPAGRPPRRRVSPGPSAGCRARRAAGPGRRPASPGARRPDRPRGGAPTRRGPRPCRAGREPRRDGPGGRCPPRSAYPRTRDAPRSPRPARPGRPPGGG